MTKDPNSEWGCAAVGRSGDIQIDIAETCSGPDRWELCIDHPQLHLRFAISGSQIVADFLCFLQKHWNRTSSAELALGTIGNALVSLIKDDEFVDRFFFCVLSDDGAVRYTLNANEITNYVGALQSALENYAT